MPLLAQIHALHRRVSDGELTTSQAEGALVFGGYLEDWAVARDVMATDPIALEAQLDRQFRFRVATFVTTAAMGVGKDVPAREAFERAAYDLSSEVRLGLRSPEEAAFQLVTDNHTSQYQQMATLMRHLDVAFTRIITSPTELQGACVLARSVDRSAGVAHATSR